MDTQVIIVGGGPVGLTLAIDLGQRGMRCTLVEQKDAPQFLPKMERCNARTMEIYRRMGIAQNIRAAGLPPTCRWMCSSSCRWPSRRWCIPYPSVARRRPRSTRALTAACRSSPISSSRNTRSSRC